MNVTITGRHIAVTDAIKEHTNNLFSKINAKYEVIHQSLVFTKESDFFKVRAEYKTNKHEVVCECKNEDLYLAITQVANLIEEKLRRKKTQAI